MSTKTLLAAGAVLFALALPAAAQTSGATSANPNISSRPDLWTNGQNPAPGYPDAGVDYGTTQSILPAPDAMPAGRADDDNSSPVDEDSSENGGRAVGGRSN